MENIQKLIEHERKILGDPMVSSQSRRHAEEELESLERYKERHLGEEKDQSPLELFCDENPSALECRIYED